jgi:hypothetical protein
MTRTHPIFKFGKSGTKAKPKQTSCSTIQNGIDSIFHDGNATKAASKPSPQPSTSTQSQVKTRGQSDLVLNPANLPTEFVQNSCPKSSVRIENEVERQPSSSRQSNPKSVSKPRKLNATEDDAIRTTKRRLGKRQKKILPHAPNPSQQSAFARVGNRVPRHRVKDTARKGCWGRFSRSLKNAWESFKKATRKAYGKAMEKKAKWDIWNPDRDHPLAKCIDESKLAGLKETIKPNRGILYR